MKDLTLRSDGNGMSHCSSKKLRIKPRLIGRKLEAPRVIETTEIGREPRKGGPIQRQKRGNPPVPERISTATKASPNNEKILVAERGKGIRGDPDLEKAADSTKSVSSLDKVVTQKEGERKGQGGKRKGSREVQHVRGETDQTRMSSRILAGGVIGHDGRTGGRDKNSKGREQSTGA